MCSLRCIRHFLCIPSEPLAISATKEETSLSSASAVLALLVLTCEMFQKSPRACMYAGWKLGGVHAQWGRTLTHTAQGQVNNCCSIYIGSNNHLYFAVINSNAFLFWFCPFPTLLLCTSSLIPGITLSRKICVRLSSQGTWAKNVLGQIPGPRMASALKCTHSCLISSDPHPSVLLLAEMFPLLSHDSLKMSP